MNKTLCLLLFLLITVQPAAALESATGLLKSFFDSREVIATVDFADGSSGLTSRAKEEIDRIAPRLSRLDPRKTLVRIEGFASTDGNKWVNVPISMARARAVMDYLRDNYQMNTVDLSLTGFGSGKGGSRLEVEPGCRAEIALYDNAWEMPGTTIEKVGAK